MQPFWKDYDKQIKEDSAKIDPKAKLSVPSSRVKARKDSFGNKKSFKFKNMGGMNKEMNQTQIIFSQKNDNLQDELPQLVGSAHTTKRILVPQDPAETR
jgi:hypothetical protein